MKLNLAYAFTFLVCFGCVPFSDSSVTGNYQPVIPGAAYSTPSASCIPTQLSFQVQPTNVTVGIAFSPAIQVSVLDAQGVICNQATNSVSLSLGSNPGSGSLSGTLVAPPVNGIATFSNVSVSTSGNNYSLIASSNGLIPSTSHAFNVSTVSYVSYVYSVAYGTNQLFGFSMNPNTGALSSLAGVPMPDGSNPHSLASNGKFLFSLDAGSNTIYAYRISPANGTLTLLSGYPQAWVGGGQQFIRFDPSGKFLYTSSGSQIYGNVIDSVTGAATSAILGSPWSLSANAFGIAIDPFGRFLYAGHSSGTSSLDAFSINSAAGTLTSVPGSPTEIVGSPWNTGTNPNRVLVDPSGKFIYTANYGNSTISGFSITPGTGALLPLIHSPYPSGNGSTSLAFDPSGRFLFNGDYNDDLISCYELNASTGDITIAISSPTHSGNNVYDLVVVSP